MKINHGQETVVQIEIQEGETGEEEVVHQNHLCLEEKKPHLENRHHLVHLVGHHHLHCHLECCIVRDPDPDPGLDLDQDPDQGLDRGQDRDHFPDPEVFLEVDQEADQIQEQDIGVMSLDWINVDDLGLDPGKLQSAKIFISKFE